VPGLVFQIVAINPPEDCPRLELVPVPRLSRHILAETDLTATGTPQQVQREIAVPLRIAGTVDLSLRKRGSARPRPSEAGQFAAAVAILQPVGAKNTVSILRNFGLAMDSAERDPVVLCGIVGQVSVYVIKTQPEA